MKLFMYTVGFHNKKQIKKKEMAKVKMGHPPGQCEQNQHATIIN